MTMVYVGIGSNIDRTHHIRAAVQALRQAVGPLAQSPVYESRAQGFDGPDFYNLVVSFESGATLPEIRALLSHIERTLGRARSNNQYESRTIDLDLLLYGDTICHDDDIDLPRTEIMEYAFVLKPLSDLAPEAIHPETGLSFKLMWDQFEANQPLWPVTPAPDLG